MNQDRIKELEEAIEEILECTDGFYDNSVSPSRVYPELKKHIGYINVIRKTCVDALKNKHIEDHTN